MTLDNCCDSHIKVLDEISEGQANRTKKIENQSIKKICRGIISDWSSRKQFLRHSPKNLVDGQYRHFRVKNYLLGNTSDHEFLESSDSDTANNYDIHFCIFSEF
jgi:hypothetical protein